MKKIAARRRFCCFLVIIIGLAVVSSGCLKEGEQGTQEDDYSQILEDAYTFAFPLVLLDATARNSTNTVEPSGDRAPVNQLMHAEKLADSEDKFVVTPNVDTVYSQVYLDLSSQAMIFEKPAADRFFSVEIMDAYTNCVKLLGTGAGTQGEETYLLAGPDFDGEVPDGVQLVNIPTNNAWMLIRIIVKDKNDFENVYAIQDAMHIMPLSAFGQEYVPPKGTYDEENDYVPIDYVLAMTPEEFFARANELMIKNPPAEADFEIVEDMKKINVGAGLAFDPELLSEQTADWDAFIGGFEERLTADSSQFMKGIGIWQFWGEPIAEFGTEYDYRALIALGGLGANPVSIAIYPKADSDDDGQALNGKNSYTLHFEKTPPVGENGFWSITAYGEDNFLIDNDIDRYAINDRSDLKYNDDGSLDILIQAEPPVDSAMRGNWLPVKEDGFHLHLRVYLPDESILDGEWTAPGISKNDQ